MSEKTMTGRDLAAFDGGHGQRCVSYRHENPFDLATQPDRHAAWESGWSAADRELTRNDWPDAPLPDEQLANGGACS